MYPLSKIFVTIMQQKSFSKSLVFFTVIVACFTGLMQNAQHKFVLNNLVWVALTYYFLLSLVTGIITQSGMKKDNKTFITRTYGAIGIRFIFSICPLLIYLLFSPGREMPFIVSYILMYFLFTSFEIYFLVITLRPDSKK